MYQRIIKPALDVICAFFALVFLMPLFIALMIAIKIDSEGKVFFTQQRVGKNKKTFNIIKFRTMKTDTPKDVPTHLLDNPDQYITRLGRFLRKSSLDELPQIINILTGKMSIIGPRPALWNQQNLIELRDQHNVNELLPGLSGWAQINGRDELPIEQKVALDGYYAQNISFVLDVKIFFLTFLKVIKSDGVVEGKQP